jgi:hypothetical protein
MMIHLNVDTGAYLMKMVAAQKRRAWLLPVPRNINGSSAQRRCIFKKSNAAWRMPFAAVSRRKSGR